ncbi:MAG: ABC transporter substrate-binding protein [Clostridia bacterium]|nr:ABC transporter substrate-binding protein [Clostridia bacterium]
MKKILSLILVLLFSLSFIVSCDNSEKADVKVAVLSGTTGFGMAHLMEQNLNGASNNNYNFSVETKPDDVKAQILNNSIDIAAVPTNLASALYNATKGGVKVLAINTLGVLYAVENGNTVKTIKDLEGKTIYCPAQNPEFVLKHIINKNKINATIDTTFSDPADLRTAIASGELKDENVIAVLPEPMVTIAKSANKSLNVVLDLTEEWGKVENKDLVQGCVIVRSEFLQSNPDAVEAFLDEYKSSIEYLNENVDDAAKLIVKHGIFAKEAVAKAAIPNCNVTYMDGTQMKDAMSGFLSAMFSVAPKSIGGKLPEDDFYYSK